MSEGTEDEGGVGPEVVVHRADPGVVHVVVHTGRGPVHDGVDAEVVDGLPSVPVQPGHVLPDIAGQNTIVAVVIEELEGQDVMAVLVRLVVELEEMVAHGKEAVMVKPDGVSLSCSLRQRDGEKVRAG